MMPAYVNPNTKCYLIAFLYMFSSANKDLCTDPPSIQLNAMDAMNGADSHTFFKTLVNIVYTNERITYTADEVETFLAQFLDLINANEQKKLDYHEKHMYAESVFNELNDYEFFREMQLPVRRKITRQNCALNCPDPDPNIQFCISESITIPTNYSVYPIPMPNEGNKY